MLEKVFWGNTVENWGVAALIVVATIAVAKIVSLFNKRILKSFTKNTKNRFDDAVYEAIESPVVFGVILLGMWITIHRLAYSDTFIRVVDSSYRILIVLNVTWLLARFLNSLIATYWENNPNQKHSVRMMPVVKRTVLVIVWIIGGITALSNVGVNISALLGTLGIGGIAFALAAQDTIKNIFGAFTILTDKPFALGDTVRVGEFEGKVVDVGVRSTKLRNYDKRIITVPNYKISDASIVNISAEPMRRVVMKIGLTYDTAPGKMAEAMDILRNIPPAVKFVSPKDLVANFSDFTDSALVITFVYYIEKKADIGKTTSDVNMEILKAFNSAGLNFAFPSQTLYIGGGGLAPQQTEPDAPGN